MRQWLRDDALEPRVKEGLEEASHALSLRLSVPIAIGNLKVRTYADTSYANNTFAHTVCMYPQTASCMMTR